MSRQDKTREVILQLKAVKEERGISLQRVHDITTEKGGNVSFSTVRKIFSEGSENMNFRYEDTVQPVAMALLDTDEPPREVSGVVETEAEALKALVQLKNSIIKEYQEKIDKMEEREAEIKAEAQRKIDHLVKEGERKDLLLDQRKDFMDERADFIHRKDKAIAVLSIALTFMTLLAIFALGSDAIIPLF